MLSRYDNSAGTSRSTAFRRRTGITTKSALRDTVLAGNVTLGSRTCSTRVTATRTEGSTRTICTLPISERFFSGGSTTLRGFNLKKLVHERS